MTCTMAHQRNSPFLGISCAKNVKGISSIIAYYIIHLNCIKGFFYGHFKGVLSLWLFGSFFFFNLQDYSWK